MNSMTPVELLLQGRKQAAKQAAKSLHLVELSSMVIPFGFPAVDRWTLGAYLLGWATWEQAEAILKR
jgi:hypothetical protein